MSNKINVSIEARMNSSRLPGKVLKKIFGKPSIEILIDRLRLAKNIDEIIIATTTSKDDDILVEWCKSYGVKFFRGSEEDVLGRVVEAHKSLETDIVVSLTGDCPLTDPEVIDLGVASFLSNQCDYLTNCEIQSYPQGICVQVFKFKDLNEIEKKFIDPVVREHVTVPFYENKDIYRNINLIAPRSLQLPIYCRTQLDYPEDLLFLNTIAENLVPKFGYTFPLSELVNLLNENPKLIDINRNCVEKKVR